MIKDKATVRDKIQDVVYKRGVVEVFQEMRCLQGGK